MRPLLAVALVVAARCDCDRGCEEAQGLVDDFEEQTSQDDDVDLDAVDPVAHAWIREQPEIASAAGAPIARIEHQTVELLGKLNTPGTIDGVFARHVVYDVTGATGTVTVEVYAVRGDDGWSIRFGYVGPALGRTRLGDPHAEFLMPSGGGDWD